MKLCTSGLVLTAGLLVWSCESGENAEDAGSDAWHDGTAQDAGDGNDMEDGSGDDGIPDGADEINGDEGADDSSAINNASLDKWNTYVDHMVAAFEEYPIVWVLGLEVDEYWSSAQVSDRRAYLQSQTQHPVGVHLTINETRNVSSGYKTGFDFIMVQFDSPQSDSEYVNDSNQYILLDRPYVAAEFNVSGTGGESSVTARSKAIGTVIGGVGNPSKACGIGNGVNVRN